jgi:hypothetical protein
MSLSDLFADAWSKSQTGGVAVLTKKQHHPRLKREARLSHKQNARIKRVETRVWNQGKFDAFFCFQHHDKLVTLYGRKGADFLGRRIKDKDNKLDFREACLCGEVILKAAGAGNIGRGCFGSGTI